MGDKKKKKAIPAVGKAPLINGKAHPPVSSHPAEIPTIRIGKDCDYDKELSRLQVELVKLHEWIRHEHLKVVVLFEGRDAAGKGGAIKRITETLNPRICKVVALGTPTEREKTQWYFQRTFLICPLPAKWSSSTAVGITAPVWSG